MSFRIEEKIVLHISDYLNIKKMIKEESSDFFLYPPRQIKSLYFDNYNNDMFKESEEGSLPRKKIRIRTYPNSDKKKLFLEKKINSFEGKFKKVFVISERDFLSYCNLGIFDKMYNNCMPKFWVVYEREYFSYLGFRFTIDKNITYHGYKNHQIENINDKIILEIKSKKLETDIFDGKFPFDRVRFSKYCEGFKLICR